jgi:hypothetical protein
MKNRKKSQARLGQARTAQDWTGEIASAEQDNGGGRRARAMAASRRQQPVVTSRGSGGGDGDGMVVAATAVVVVVASMILASWARRTRRLVLPAVRAASCHCYCCPSEPSY